MRRYHGFVRLKASSYFLAGGDAEDLVQEGMIGLFKAIRDFRHDKETSFRSFAELCVTRQIITAIKSATRFKHAPLNTYVSFSHTPGGAGHRGRVHPRRRAARPADRRSVRPRRLDRGAAGARRLPRHEPLGPRVGGAPPLPRRALVRDDGRRARLRLQDDRQRAPAREAEDPRAPGDARRACLSDPAGAARYRLRTDNACVEGTQALSLPPLGAHRKAKREAGEGIRTLGPRFTRAVL